MLLVGVDCSVKNIVFAILLLLSAVLNTVVKGRGKTNNSVALELLNIEIRVVWIIVGIRRSGDSLTRRSWLSVSFLLHQSKKGDQHFSRDEVTRISVRAKRAVQTYYLSTIHSRQETRRESSSSCIYYGVEFEDSSLGLLHRHSSDNNSQAPQ
jgi:hypothetical protein